MEIAVILASVLTALGLVLATAHSVGWWVAIQREWISLEHQRIGVDAAIDELDGIEDDIHKSYASLTGGWKSRAESIRNRVAAVRDRLVDGKGA
jgi:hypothetical protein